jgi:hypothetical protein
VPTATPQKLYQPLAVGDSWGYQCHNTKNQNEQPYAIANTVLGKTTVGSTTVYEFSLQIPASPTQIATTVELLANDANGNTSIYGYLVNGAVQTVTPSVIVSATPVVNAYYDYLSADGSTITRQFVGFEPSNKTGLGIFTVAPYFESAGTHNYGYALGVGIVEEDHGPNFQYDCLVTSATVTSIR